MPRMYARAYGIMLRKERKRLAYTYRIPMVGRPFWSSLSPLSSTISNIFSSETTRPMKGKFHVEPPWEGAPWEGGMKVNINGSGHMSKMTAMLVYGKKNLKIFFSRTRSPMILKLGK